MPTFCSSPKTLKDIRAERLVHLLEEVSRQHNVQAVVMDMAGGFLASFMLNIKTKRHI